MNFRTVSDLTKTIMKKIDIIPSDIDLIVGIPRSGLLVANYIALLLNKPITKFLFNLFKLNNYLFIIFKQYYKD